MIELFEGRLGGGKTYTAVARIAYHLSTGGTVFTNIRLRENELFAFVEEAYGVIPERDQLAKLTNTQIPEAHKHLSWGTSRGTSKEEAVRVLGVIDEAQLFFNSRKWQSANETFFAFLTQSDKVSVDLVLIAPSVTLIDKQFRVMVQYYWRFRDLAKWKIPGLGIMSPIKSILSCQYDYDGTTLLEKRFVKKDPRIFKCYDTAALLTEFPDTAGRVAKRDLQKTPKKETNMLKLLIPLFFVGCIAAIFIAKKVASPPPAPSASTQKASSASPATVGGVFGAVGSSGTSKQSSASPATAYDIYAERFVAFMGTSLKTSEGWYQLGEMSGKGFVTAVSDRRARILQPDGRIGWIVAEDLPVTSEAASASGTAGKQGGAL